MELLADAAHAAYRKKRNAESRARERRTVIAFLVHAGQTRGMLDSQDLFGDFKGFETRAGCRPGEARFTALVREVLPDHASLSGPKARAALALACTKGVGELFPGAITPGECAKFAAAAPFTSPDVCIDRLLTLGNEVMAILRHTARTSPALVARYFDHIDVATVALQSAGGAKAPFSRHAQAVIALFFRQQFPARTAVVSADFAPDAVARGVARAQQCGACGENGAFAGLCFCFEEVATCACAADAVVLGSPSLWATFVGAEVPRPSVAVLSAWGGIRINYTMVAAAFGDRWPAVHARVGASGGPNVDAFVADAITAAATSATLAPDPMRAIAALLVRFPTGDRKCEMRRWGRVIEWLSKAPPSAVTLETTALVHAGRMALEYALGCVVGHGREPTASVFCAVGAVVGAIAALWQKGGEDETGAHEWITAPAVVARVRELAATRGMAATGETGRMWAVFVALTLPSKNVGEVVAAVQRVTRGSEADAKGEMARMMAGAEGI